MPRLLSRSRTPLNLVLDAHEWGPYDEVDVIKKLDVYDGRGIFPIQNSLKLQAMDQETKRILCSQCNDLYDR